MISKRAPSVMMKFTPFFTALILQTTLFAQSFLKLSPVLESSTAERSYALIAYDSTFYALMRNNKSFKYAETEIFNSELKHLKTYVSSSEPRNYAGVINLEGRMFMLYSYYRDNRQLEQYEDVSLWAMPMSSDSFCVSDDSFALVQPFTLKSPFYRGNFVISPDRSKILVYDWEEEGDIDGINGLSNEITLRVYDNNFKLLWIRKINLTANPSGKRVIAIKKIRVSNSGEAAILTDYFRNHRSYSMKEVTADPTLFFVGKDPADFSRLTPNLGNLYFNEPDFIYDENGNIIWFGFYSNRKYHQQAGYFYIKINAERNKILSKKISPFSEELLKSLLRKKKLRKNTELRNLEIQYFKITADGDLVLSAELKPFAVSNYKSHDIIVLRFDKNGNLKWGRHIFKYNTFPYSLKVFLEHYMQTDNDNVYLLFNQGIYAESGKARAVKIDRNGNITEKTVFNYLNQGNIICPTQSTALPDGRCFISLQSRFFKYHQAGILDFRKLFE